MVNRLLSVALVLGAVCTAQAQISEAQNAAILGRNDLFDEGTNTDKRPFKRGVLKVVKVYPVGPDRAPQCAGFNVTKPLVIEFIRRAKQISAHDYWHENTWSSCTSQGEFRFKDGRRGYWHIQQYGQGHLTIRGKKYYFLCEPCKVNGWGAKDPVEEYLEQTRTKP